MIAAKESFDWPPILTGAAYGGLGQLSNQNPCFGQGGAGYGNRFARVYADEVMRHLLTEGLMPSLLREDPRYFQRGQGSFWGCVGYATSRILVTRNDSGVTHFNSSELLGNCICGGISNAYYPDGRTAAANFGELCFQLGTDAVSNNLKEFWRDVKHRLLGRPANQQP